MPIADGNIVKVLLVLLASVLCAYGFGRAHQWYRHSMDRDRAFREGFDDGYHALFPLAARRRQR